MTQALKKIFSCDNLNKINSKKNRRSSKVEDNIVYQLHERIVSNLYKAQNLSFFLIQKSHKKERVLCICSPQDSLVQRTLLEHLNTKIKPLGLDNNISFCIKGKSVSDAIKRSIEKRGKNQWVLKTDISAFFDSIDRTMLIDMLSKKSRLLKTYYQYLLR